MVFHALPPARESGRGVCVEGEDVDVATTEIVKVATLDERCRRILNLAEGEGIERVVLGAHKFERFGKPFLGVGDEAFIVGAWHRHVEVVVPRDKPLVAHRAYHSAAADAVTQSVTGAHFVKLQQDVQYPLLEFLNVIISHYRDLSVNVDNSSRVAPRRDPTMRESVGHQFAVAAARGLLAVVTGALVVLIFAVGSLIEHDVAVTFK